MSVKEQDRIKRYIVARLGERGRSRDGLARLIQEYVGWVDKYDDNVAAVKSYIEHNDLIGNSRHRFKIHQRAYLYKFLRVKHKMTYYRMARLFDKNHATIMHGVKKHDDMMDIKDKLYLEHTEGLRETFVIPTKNK